MSFNIPYTWKCIHMPPNDNNAPNNINLYLYAILYVVKKLIPWDSSKKILVISLFKIVDMM